MDGIVTSVTKRNGSIKEFNCEDLVGHLERLCYGLDKRFVSPARVVQSLTPGLYNGITTREIDRVTAEAASSLISFHYDYGLLAGRVEIHALHKETFGFFSDAVKAMYENQDSVLGSRAPLISDELYNIVIDNRDVLDAACDYDRDYYLDYFAVRTLLQSYLLKSGGRVLERPEQLFLRVALGIHGADIAHVLETHKYMSTKYFIHASPTLFNAGTQSPQLASCFLAQLKAPSVDGVFDTIRDCAMISKGAGGIGLSVHDLFAVGTQVPDVAGSIDGVVPVLNVLNATARCVSQGGNKRPGAIAIYIEPWHADILYVLDMKKNVGQQEFRARDLFYALWIPDLFMRRVRDDQNWSLFCPSEAPALVAVSGADFDLQYEAYERRSRAKKVLRARALWFAILESQIETGGPFMLYKDTSNVKSNQRNLGMIRGSNLCTEIIQHVSPDEVSVCNLASIALPRFVLDTEDGNTTYDFIRLHEIVKIVTFNLNRVIDRTLYPIPEAKKCNLRHRPMGIGVQGLADVFLMMRMSFDSPSAKALNARIFETIYHAALDASCELAAVDGPYDSWLGCPAESGHLQFDLWNKTPSDLWDWASLKKRISSHGLRNSLLVALMPTASTSQILGCSESFEPYTSNLYYRRVLAGNFQVVCRWLIRDLVKLGLWNDETRQRLLLDDGSVQSLDFVPEDMKRLYKTIWEIPQRVLIDLAADRAPFVDQSQSLFLYLPHPTVAQLSSMHFYAWDKGLKTGMYYLRTKPAGRAIPFTVRESRSEQAHLATPLETGTHLDAGHTGYSNSEDLSHNNPDETVECRSCSA